MSFLIREFPDQRLLHASPELFAATPRPSSPLTAKASTICSWVLLGTQKTILSDTRKSAERNRNIILRTFFRTLTSVLCDHQHISTDEKTSLRMDLKVKHVGVLLDDHTFLLSHTAPEKTVMRICISFDIPISRCYHQRYYRLVNREWNSYFKEVIVQPYRSLNKNPLRADTSQTRRVSRFIAEIE